MLIIENLCYKNILRNINFSVKLGELALVCGENGSGKTTLFNILSGIKQQSSGKIFLDDRELSSIPLCQRSALIANVLQDPRQGTIENMTIFENLCIAFFRGKKHTMALPNNELHNYFKHRLALLHIGLENRLSEYVGNLSGGQRQCLSLMMATLANFRLLLLDEVTAAVDSKTSPILLNYSRAMLKEKSACGLLISHDKEFIATFTGAILNL